MLNALLTTERNFTRVDHNFGKVAHAINKQAKCISKVAGLSSIAFLCIGLLFSIQDKQIKAIEAQVRKLENLKEGCCGECGCDEFAKGCKDDLDESEQD